MPAGRAKPDWAASALAVPGARKAKLVNRAFPPQLAKLGSAPPDGADWIHELKWDGYRLLGTVVAGEAKLWSRNAIEWTAKQPRIAAALQRLPITSLAVDGELIAGGGRQEDFNLLQATLSGETRGGLGLVLFDLLHIDGIDVSGCPLIERKGLLARLLAKPPAGISFSAHVDGSGRDAFQAAAGAGFEGIISKRASRPYAAGRGDDWRKTKHLPSEEYAVVGWMPGEGGRSGSVGSLLLATPDQEHGWRYVGRVGSGFTTELLRQLDARIGGCGQGTPSVHVPTGKQRSLRKARWFPPSFVAEVFLRGITGQGVLRQPSLKALRLDKRPDDLG